MADGVTLPNGWQALKDTKLTRAQVRQLVSETLASFRNNPMGFVKWAFPWGVPGTPLENESVEDWQRNLLGHIKDHLEDTPFEVGRFGVASGHGPGKSAVVAWLCLWSSMCWPLTRGTVTANTDTQLKTKTWPELHKWFYMMLPEVRDEFELSATRLQAKNTKNPDGWRIDAVPWSRANPAAFAGLHNAGRQVIIIMDEASEIYDVIWDNVEGAFTDKNTRILMFAFGNPTLATGRFKEVIVGRLRSSWRSLQLDCRKVNRVNKNLIASWIEAFGLDSDFVRIRVLGQFPRVSAMTFINEEWVEAAMERKPDYIPADPIVFGLDVARHGDDASVLAIRRGRDARSIPWRIWRIPDLMDLAGMVALEIEKYQPDQVFIDVTGMGWGVYDRLVQLGYSGRVMPVTAGATYGDVVTFNGIQIRAKTMTDMTWCAMREWLRGGSLPNAESQGAMAVQALKQDMIGRTYKHGGDDQAEVVLETKDQMKARQLASPDHADALALTFAYPVAPRHVDGDPKTIGTVQPGGMRVTTDYDVFADVK